MEHHVIQQPVDTDHKTELVTNYACSVLFEPQQNAMQEQEKQKDNETTIKPLPDDFLSKEQKLNKHSIIKSEPEFAIFRTKYSRLKSFYGWPKNYFLPAETLASAGFVHLTEKIQFKLNRTGRKIPTADYCVCHYCNLGLYNWELGDNPWIEHARNYPKCKFVQSRLGIDFVAVVQYLQKPLEIMPLDRVEDELHKRGLPYDRCNLLGQDNWEQDPAVMALVDAGFNLATVLESHQRITNNDISLSAAALYEDIISHDAATYKQFSEKERQKDNEDENNLAVLKKKIAECRQEQECKICLVKVADIMFLPCGHLLTCMECANDIVDSCPVCRKKIDNIIRVYFN